MITRSNHHFDLIRQTKYLFVLVLAMTVMTILTHPAWAQATTATMANTSQRVAQQASIIPKLGAMMSYVMGTFFAAAGLFKIKDWMVDSDRNTMIAGLMRIVVATLLILLPYTLKIAAGTLYGKDNGAGGVRMDAYREVGAPAFQAFKRTRQ